MDISVRETKNGRGIVIEAILPSGNYIGRIDEEAKGKGKTQPSEPTWEYEVFRMRHRRDGDEGVMLASKTRLESKDDACRECASLLCRFLIREAEREMSGLILY